VGIFITIIIIIIIIILVEEDNVRLPDFLRENSNDRDAAIVSRIPHQLIVLPALQLH